MFQVNVGHSFVRSDCQVSVHAVYIDCEHETDERLDNCPAVHTSNLIEHAGFVFS